MKRLELGPGLLLAATGIGVGDMVASTIAGAEYGLTLLWALAAGVVIKLAITEGLARWQLVTGTTLLQGWREKLPGPVLVAFLAYFTVWSFFVSSALVAASALVPAALIPSVPLPVWGAVHAVAAFLMILVGRYDRFLAVIKVFIVLKFGAVVASALLIALWSGADWAGFAAREPFSATAALSFIGGVGGTVTLLSYGYWIREAGWSGRARVATARVDLLVSFALVFVFCLSMTFVSTQVDWTGHVLDEGPRLCLLLADRIGQEIGPVGRNVFLLGFWGAAFSSVLGVWHGVPFLFDDWIRTWRQPVVPSNVEGRLRSGQAAGRRSAQAGAPYRLWAGYLTLGSIAALVIGRPIWIVFAYTIVGSFFFPFVIATLLWLNGSGRVRSEAPSGAVITGVLVAALVLYVFLALRATVF